MSDCNRGSQLGESGSQRRVGVLPQSAQHKRVYLATSAALALVATIFIVSAGGGAWRPTSPASTVLTEEAKQLGALYDAAGERVPAAVKAAEALVATRDASRAGTMDGGEEDGAAVTSELTNLKTKVRGEQSEMSALVKGVQSSQTERSAEKDRLQEAASALKQRVGDELQQQKNTLRTQLQREMLARAGEETRREAAGEEGLRGEVKGVEEKMEEERGVLDAQLQRVSKRVLVLEHEEEQEQRKEAAEAHAQQQRRIQEHANAKGKEARRPAAAPAPPPARSARSEKTRGPAPLQEHSTHPSTHGHRPPADSAVSKVGRIPSGSSSASSAPLQHVSALSSSSSSSPASSPLSSSSSSRTKEGGEEAAALASLARAVQRDHAEDVKQIQKQSRDIAFLEGELLARGADSTAAAASTASTLIVGDTAAAIGGARPGARNLGRETPWSQRASAPAELPSRASGGRGDADGRAQRERQYTKDKAGAAVRRVYNRKPDGSAQRQSAAEEIRELEAEAERLGYKIAAKAKPQDVIAPKLSALRKEAREGGYELPADARMLNAHDNVTLDFKPGAASLGNAAAVEKKEEEDVPEKKGKKEDHGGGKASAKSAGRAGEIRAVPGKAEEKKGKWGKEKEGKWGKEPEPPMGMEGASLLDSIGRWLYGFT